ncbi:threonine synthase [Streptococcus pneumoniae]|nr:threonine synthase [Streptococcus pneumoniae]
MAEIKRVYESDSYIEDPHTAVASAVYRKYQATTGDATKTVIASTASPYKFPVVAVEALTGKVGLTDFEALDFHRSGSCYFQCYFKKHRAERPVEVGLSCD